MLFKGQLYSLTQLEMRVCELTGGVPTARMVGALSPALVSGSAVYLTFV